MSQSLVRQQPQNGSVARQEFGAHQVAKTAETATAAAIEHERAMVQSRCILAMQSPRDWGRVRERLLADCVRPRFAEEAIYHKPIGDGIEGPSARFAEAAARHMGNLDVKARVVYDDPQKRHVLVWAFDLENNLSHEVEIVIEKIVERSKADDRVVLGRRKNSKGFEVYIVQATDDEILNKVNALVSKARRQVILAHLPADITEECMDSAKATKLRQAESNLPAERVAAVKSFAALGVTAVMLEEWLGRPFDSVTPDELVRLRQVYNALHDGEGTWADQIEARRAAREPVASSKSQHQAPPAPAKPAASPPAAAPAPAVQSIPEDGRPGEAGAAADEPEAAFERWLAAVKAADMDTLQRELVKKLRSFPEDLQRKGWDAISARKAAINGGK